MSPAQKLGLPSWLPPFCWSSPLAWFTYLLLVDAGVLMVSWWLIERVWHRQYYMSNLIGDTIGLPILALASAMLLRKMGDHVNAWYTNKWWFIAVGVGLCLFWYPHTFGDPHVNGAQRMAPSSIWHTALWPYFAFILIAGAPAALRQIPQLWLALPLVVVGFVIWFGTYQYDVSRNPPPLGGGVEFSWSKFFSGDNPSKLRLDEWEAAGKPLPDWFDQYYNPDGTPK